MTAPVHLTDEQAAHVVAAAQTVFTNLKQEAAMVCAHHDLVEPDQLTRVLLLMTEAILFGVVANHIKPEFHSEVVNHMSGGVLMRLKEFRADLRKTLDETGS